MAGFDSVLKSIGYAVGATTGGPSQVKAVAGAVAFNGKINSYLESIGRKLGGTVGPDLFRKIAGGAEVTGDAETRTFVQKNILTTPAQNKILFVSLIVLSIAGYFFYRKHP